MPGLLVGASVFTGDSGQGHFTPSGQKIHGADDRGRRAMPTGDGGGCGCAGSTRTPRSTQADLINQLNSFEGDESIGSRQEGWYVQGGFDVLSLMSGARMSLIPFVRYEEYDTQTEVPVGYARNPRTTSQELTLGAHVQADRPARR